SGGEAKIYPRLFGREAIKKADGIFTMGKSSLPAKVSERKNFDHLPAPNYDPDFKNFIDLLDQTESQLVETNLIKLPLATEAKAWQVFWHDISITLTLNLGLALPRDTQILISALIHRLFDEFLVNVSNKHDNYIDFDEVIYRLWDILYHYDDQLVPFEQVSANNDKGIEKMLSSKKGTYSLTVFYNLTNLFDELFLFPADQYFGVVECVWTDKISFFNDLMTTCQLLKNDLKIPLPSKITSKQKKFLATGIEEKVTDIYRLWFSPPTAFRFLPQVRELL
ncbi:MAG: hypothetical protein NTY61_03775, partial [Candidatus Parcubacteria bacterium]|nr:hypothetical protein [Candidatus Parcubacteria bacterium]